MPEQIHRLTGIVGWRGLAVSFLSGAGLGLGHVPFSLYLIAFPALCFSILWAATSSDPRQAVRRGFFVGFGYAVVSINWIVEPFLVDIALHGWIAPFALAAMASGFGVFWGAAFWTAAKFAPVDGSSRIIAIISAITGVELLRSYLLTGFPWALISYIWIETPIYQLSAVLGPHGLTLATLGVAGLIVAGLRHKKAILLVSAALISLVLVLAGLFLGRDAGSDNATQPLVRLIQPNADQIKKWDPEMMPIFYNRQLTFTEDVSDLTPDAPDIIVWPEVAVPFLLNDPDAPLWEIAGAAKDATVILGAQRLDAWRAYNSLAVLDNVGNITQTYDKHHLVPFGEYVPGGWFLERFGLKALTAKYGFGFSAGPGPVTLNLGPLGTILPLICYEGIFPHELRRVQNRPDWMLLITNDAWFGEISGPYQHLAQARARSIETGLPMVRVANTGISAVIDAKGRIIASIEQGVAGYKDVKLPKPEKATIYWQTGDIPALFFVIVLGLAALRLRRTNSD